MNAIIRILIILLFSPLALLSQSKQQQIEDILDRYNNKKDSPAMAILVMKDAETLYKNTYGYTNPERGKKLQSRDRFHLVGVSSQFTAISIMQLVADDLLKMDDKIGDILPELPDYVHSVTINHLMNHISGIPRVDQQKIINEHGFVDASLMIKALHDETALSYKPGSKMEINPVNYVLLAEIVKALSGSYEDHVKNKIFKPLGMKKSYVFSGEKKFWHWRIVDGYVNPSGEKLMVDPSQNNYKYLGTRGIYVSIDDYARFLSIYDTDALLPPPVMAESFRMSFFQPNLQKYPGKGWYLGFNKGVLYAYQPGAGTGYTHIVMRIPGENLSVAIFTNQRAVFGLRKTAFEIINLYSENSFNPE